MGNKTISFSPIGCLYITVLTKFKSFFSDIMQQFTKKITGFLSFEKTTLPKFGRKNRDPMKKRERVFF